MALDCLQSPFFLRVSRELNQPSADTKAEGLNEKGEPNFARLVFLTPLVLQYHKRKFERETDCKQSPLFRSEGFSPAAYFTFVLLYLIYLSTEEKSYQNTLSENLLSRSLCIRSSLFKAFLFLVMH